MNNENINNILPILIDNNNTNIRNINIGEIIDNNILDRHRYNNTNEIINNEIYYIDNRNSENNRNRNSENRNSGNNPNRNPNRNSENNRNRNSGNNPNPNENSGNNPNQNSENQNSGNNPNSNRNSVSSENGIINCPICFDDIEENSERRLICRHIFHRECIERYIRVSRNNDIIASCPLCRRVIQ